MSVLLPAAMFGPSEILIVVLIILVIFGASQLPKLARSFGKSANEFKKGLKEGEEDLGEEKKVASTEGEEKKDSPTSED